MKKFLLTLSALVLSSVAAQGAACTNELVTLSSLLASGSCESEDKLFEFTSFASTGSLDLDSDDVLVSIDYIELGTDDVHKISLSRNPEGASNTFVAGNGFTFAYTISVLPAFPNQRIVAAQVDSTTVLGYQGTIIKGITPNAGSPFDLMSVNGAPDQAFITPATSLDVVANVVVTQGALQNVSDSYAQAEAVVPEPGTYALMGAGLLGLAVVRRRKAAK